MVLFGELDVNRMVFFASVESSRGDDLLREKANTLESFVKCILSQL